MTGERGKAQPHKFEGVQHRANFASLRAQTVMIRIPELGQIVCSREVFTGANCGTPSSAVLDSTLQKRIAGANG